MQPFTFDQALIAGLLFILGIFIGMFFLAGGKWKRRYTHEAARVRDLEADNEQLRRDAREMESLRHAAARAPAVGTSRVEERTAEDRRVTRGGDDSDLVIRRP